MYRYVKSFDSNFIKTTANRRRTEHLFDVMDEYDAKEQRDYDESMLNYTRGRSATIIQELAAYAMTECKAVNTAINDAIADAYITQSPIGDYRWKKEFFTYIREYLKGKLDHNDWFDNSRDNFHAHISGLDCWVICFDNNVKIGIDEESISDRINDATSHKTPDYVYENIDTVVTLLGDSVEYALSEIMDIYPPKIEY